MVASALHTETRQKTFVRPDAPASLSFFPPELDAHALLVKGEPQLQRLSTEKAPHLAPNFCTKKPAHPPSIQALRLLTAAWLAAAVTLGGVQPAAAQPRLLRAEGGVANPTARLDRAMALLLSGGTGPTAVGARPQAVSLAAAVAPTTGGGFVVREGVVDEAVEP